MQPPGSTLIALATDRPCARLPMTVLATVVIPLLPDAFEIDKEKRPVFPDRAADRAAKLVSFERRHPSESK